MTRPALLSLVAVLVLLPASPKLAAQVAPEPPAAAPAPLFTSHELLELTLVADFDRLEDDRGQESPERPATLRFTGPDGGVRELPLEVRTRGYFRLRRSTCSFPNLRLDFPAAAETEGTIFAGVDDLKLVGHCRDREEFEQNTLEEYLVYRLYNALTEESLRVRLARMTYQDVSGGDEPVTRYGFLVEDVDLLAARLGGIHLEAQGVDPLLLDALSSTRVELFQYMIGNTDFSIVDFHNAELFRLPDGSYHPVPYDFDFSGLVDAPYAMPAEMLGTRSVRERVYRGFCRPAVDTAALFESFLSRRPEFERILRGQPELDVKRAERAIDYLDEFFRTLESPGRSEALVERRCRAPG